MAGTQLIPHEYTLTMCGQHTSRWRAAAMCLLYCPASQSQHLPQQSLNFHWTKWPSTEIVPVFIKDISRYLYRPKVDTLFTDSVLAVNIYMPISKHWLGGKNQKTFKLRTSLSVSTTTNKSSFTLFSFSEWNIYYIPIPRKSGLNYPTHQTLNKEPQKFWRRGFLIFV